MQFRYFAIILFALLLGSCAKQGMPTGGAKDTDPPRLVSCNPPNGSTNFDHKEFYLKFDEYISIKDAENNILVSPPMAKKPEYRTKGKGLLVKLNDTLRANTTYLFQLKGAVVDFTEGNALPSLEYVLSTGNKMDSLSLCGKVLDAYSLSALEETVSVLLLDDSTGQTPLYSTRCDKQGEFCFNYIRPASYRIIALVDDNKDLKVDPSEKVAFVDGHVRVEPIKDSLSKDVALLIFSPEGERQRITSSEFKAKGLVQICSKMPLQNPQIWAEGEETIWRPKGKGDTISIWTLRQNCDSLTLRIVDNSGIDDTLRLRWRPSKKGGKGSKKEQLAKINVKTLPYYDTLKVTFQTPLDFAKCRPDSAAVVVRLKDSSATWCPLHIDSSLLEAVLPFSFVQGERYKVVVPKGCMVDIYGNTNDSLTATFAVTNAEEYGKVNVQIIADAAQSECPLIAQLLDSKGNVQQEYLTSGSSKVAFAHLVPGKYRIRVVIDANGNGKWDTGDYFKTQQPERVIMLDKTLDVRANWEYEEKVEVD